MKKETVNPVNSGAAKNVKMALSEALSGYGTLILRAVATGGAMTMLELETQIVPSFKGRNKSNIQKYAIGLVQFGFLVRYKSSGESYRYGLNKLRVAEINALLAQLERVTCVGGGTIMSCDVLVVFNEASVLQKSAFGIGDYFVSIFKQIGNPANGGQITEHEFIEILPTKYCFKMPFRSPTLETVLSKMHRDLAKIKKENATYIDAIYVIENPFY